MKNYSKGIMHLLVDKMMTEIYFSDLKPFRSPFWRRKRREGEPADGPIGEYTVEAVGVVPKTIV